MESAIMIFSNPQFGDIRTAGTADKPMFCLADLCKAVELTNPSSVKSRLEKEDVQLVDLHALNGGKEIVGNSLAEFSFSFDAGLDIVRKSLSKVFRSCLSLNSTHLREHEVVREEPDACALMCDCSPVIERNDLVQFSESFTFVGSALVDRECICIRADLDVVQISFNMSRESAAVAREYESYSLCFSDVCNNRILTHHDDVRIAKDLCDVLCHIEAVARTRITENDVLFHLFISLLLRLMAVISAAMIYGLIIQHKAALKKTSRNQKRNYSFGQRRAQRAVSSGNMLKK